MEEPVLMRHTDIGAVAGSATVASTVSITSVNLILVTMAVLVWKRDPLTDAFVKLATMETDVN